MKSKVEIAQEQYEKGESELSDAEFDSLLEKSADNLKTKVGASPSLSYAGGWEIFHHEMPMGSLAKVKDPDEFYAWIKSQKIENEDLIVTDKLDGNSIELVYKEGKLVRSLTRGDGLQGENILKNVKLIKNIQENLAVKDCSIRVEILMPLENYSKDTNGKNPRNAAAGILRRSEVDNPEAGTLEAIAFDIFFEGADFKTFEEKLCFLGTLMKTVEHKKIKADQVPKLVEKISETRTQLNYEIDGQVIQLNNLKLFDDLGEVNQRPKGAIAYKFDSLQAESIVVDIAMQTGRTGALVPVASIEPVAIGGVTVSSVSLMNLAEMKRLRVGIGSSVLVQRCNDVIPRIVSTTKNPPSGSYDTYLMESLCAGFCRGCNSQATPQMNKNNELVRMVCPNYRCPSRLAGRMDNFFETLGIKGVGEVALARLSFMIENLGDLFSFDYSKVMAPANAMKVRVSVSGAKKMKPSVFASCLGISSIGKSTWDTVFSKFTLMELLEGRICEEELCQLDGIEKEKSQSILSGIATAKTDIESLLAHVTIELPTNRNGKVVCFTGFRDPLLKRELEESGVVVKDGYSKNLFALISADPTQSSAKLEKARKDGVRIISKEEARVFEW